MSRSVLLFLPLLLASCVTSRYQDPPPPAVAQPPVAQPGPGAQAVNPNPGGLPPITAPESGVQPPGLIQPPPSILTAATERRFATPIPGRDDVVRNPYNPSGPPIKIKNLSSGAPDYRSGAELYNPGSNRSQIIVIP